MKKGLLRVVAFALSAVVLFTACDTGGNNGDDDGGDIELNEVGEYPLVDEKVKLTMFRLSMPNVENFSTNEFTKFIEEKTNVEWEFQTANQDTVDEQLNLIMSTTPLPDAFMFAAPSASRYGVREQLLMQLDDLIEPNMPNFMAYAEDRPGLMDQIRMTDGHIYGMPAVNDCFHCKYRNKMWVNTAHLDAMGVEAPTTTEEFKAVILQYLEENPEGVGISGSTGGWGQQFEDWITNAFILDPGIVSTTRPAKLVLSKDKQVESIITKDEYRDSLIYMNDLFDAGAIYDGTFTQNYEQYRTLMNEEGDPVLFAPFGTISDGFDVNSRQESYADYRVIAPIEGPEGVRNATYFMYDGINQNNFVISKDNKHPELTLRWLDYFYTLEGYLSMQFGPNEGEDWVLNPEDKVGLDGGEALYEILNPYSSDVQNHDWQDVGLNFATDEIRLGSATDPDVDISGPGGLEKLLFDETQEKGEPYGQDEDSDYQVLPVIKLTVDEETELQQIIVDVNRYMEENRTAFIRGEQDPTDDAAWDAYVSGVEDMGLTDIVETYQKAYDRMFGD